MARTGFEAPADIADYGLIGDCGTAALVSKDGSLDWLCLPNFDSPSVFGALLDPSAGRFSIRPLGSFESSHRYEPDTNVLVTRFETPSGAIELTDCFSVDSEERKKGRLLPHREILRIVQAASGGSTMRLKLQPRPEYGREHAQIEQRGSFGVVARFGPHLLILRSDLEGFAEKVRVGQEGVGLDFAAPSDRAVSFSLSYCDEAPAAFPAMGRHALDRVSRTRDYWRSWAGRCRYEGPHRDRVRRSALALKLLSFSPAGSIVAAPTTSLPERLGGKRNWDYRFCWLRDAAFTTRAFIELGYVDEARAYVSWLLHATRLTRPDLQVVYSIFGEPALEETELAGLGGYRGSRPVRIGNAAHAQFQLDVYGEVLGAVHALSPRTATLDRDAASLLEGLGKVVLARWKEADDGIWEARSGRAQYTHSKALAWAALDRLIDLGERYGLDLPYAALKEAAAQLRALIELRGYSPELKSYVRTLGGRELDASLLALPLVGYCDASAPRMKSTLFAIRKGLSRQGLLDRYSARTDDVLPPGEGAFVLCSFWLVEALAMAGEPAGAQAALDAVLRHENALGLWPEEIDRDGGGFLGNYPQAFSHLGLINAVVSLSKARPRASQA